ncbi:MAG: hypothetical protein HQL19_08010 [Candidatus Omnitrophica bacterium]|nr:hypothetical protein [Candidatus Omnitrophota bacterium]
MPKKKPVKKSVKKAAPKAAKPVHAKKLHPDAAPDILGVGLDMGTANIVAARETLRGKEVRHSRNAFLFIRDDDSTKELLGKMNIAQQRIKERHCILGKDAFEFSNYFDRATQRPMNVGVINPLERDAIHVMNLIVKGVLWEPRVPNEVCCFCVPAQPVDGAMDVNYHHNVIEIMLSVFGYQVLSMNEAYAVVLAELQEKNFTGIGISCGGGMTNICVSFKAVVIMEFSVAQGGDWIDAHAANVLNISPNKVAGIKEKGMNIVRPETMEQTTIGLFYRNYIKYFIEKIAEEFHKPDKSPQFDEPIDIVFAGGTSMVGGFLEVVRQELKKVDLGIPVGEVRKAADPFNCVAKGCLYNAQQTYKQGK